MKKIKKIIRLFTPPIINKLIKAVFIKKKNNNNINVGGWFGNYSSWDSVIKDCTGYDDNVILETVKKSLLKVKNGEAVYERDSVLFDKKEYSWVLLTNLLWIASKNNNKLNVVDFGGSLGSRYFQNKEYLEHLIEFSWNIIEQNNFVEEGKSTFEDNVLKFHYCIDDCLHMENKVLLVSNTLQYLMNPYEFIEEILKMDFEYIIFESTAFTESNTDLLTVQIVPEDIYKASYPAWFLNENKFLEKFKNKYKIKLSFDSEHTNSINIQGFKAYWKGFILIK